MMRVLVIILLTTILFFSCNNKSENQVAPDLKLKLANTYYNNQLFEAAVREYLDYAASYNLDQNRLANTYYTIAGIYFEKLHNYDKALEYYLKVRELFPESPLQNELGKQIVACLERLERSQDAQRVLDKAAALKPDEIPDHKPGEVIAKIGSRVITQGDLDFEINQLAPYFRSQLSGKSEKLEFLQQYIVQELLYDSAKRQGLENDKEVIEAAFRAKKGLMAQKVLEQEIRGSVSVKPEDVELYYKANKDKYAEKDQDGKIIRQKSFQEVAQQAANDLNTEKQQRAYQELMQRLMKAENVEIYESKIN